MKRGEITEAAAAFQNAADKARRCRLRLFQLLALADCVSSGSSCSSTSEADMGTSIDKGAVLVKGLATELDMQVPEPLE